MSVGWWVGFMGWLMSLVAPCVQVTGVCFPCLGKHNSLTLRTQSFVWWDLCSAYCADVNHSDCVSESCSGSRPLPVGLRAVLMHRVVFACSAIASAFAVGAVAYAKGCSATPYGSGVWCGEVVLLCAAKRLCSLLCGCLHSVCDLLPG